MHFKHFIKQIRMQQFTYLQFIWRILSRSNPIQFWILVIVLYYSKNNSVKPYLILSYLPQFHSDEMRNRKNSLPMELFYSKKAKKIFYDLVFHEPTSVSLEISTFLSNAHGEDPCDFDGDTLKELISWASLQRLPSDQIIIPLHLYN